MLTVPNVISLVRLACVPLFVWLLFARDEPYAAAWGTDQQEIQLSRFATAAQAALASGLAINAGHDLNRDNLGAFLQQVPGVREVSIGHALIADALELGYDATVRDYLRCMASA